jgi:hypothetical protein
MGIIHKLGIKCYEPGDGLEYGYHLSDFEEVEEQRDGMLEALVLIGKKADVYDRISSTTLHNIIRPSIEKATCKTWEEIKELLK